MATFVIPFGIMFLMGSTLQANLGRSAQLDFRLLTFTGVVGMTLFQSSAQGIASLMEDRGNDFAQEMFVSPISRYTILFGKILGETLVALAQVVPLIPFALLLRVQLTAAQMLLLVPVALAGCLLGGSFGVLMLSIVSSQQGANQIFSFVIFPQFFLAGVFNPIGVLPWYLKILSLMSPMRYAVDLTRDVGYLGTADYGRVVLFDPVTNVVVMAGMFTVFLVLGTVLFVRRETNR